MWPIPVYVHGAHSEPATLDSAFPALPAERSPRLGVVGRIIEPVETRERVELYREHGTTVLLAA